MPQGFRRRPSQVYVVEQYLPYTNLSMDIHRDIFQDSFFFRSYKYTQTANIEKKGKGVFFSSFSQLQRPIENKNLTGHIR